MAALASGVTMPTAMSLASRAEARTPRFGGHLRLSLRQGREADAVLAFATGNGLTEIGTDGRVIPALATSATPDASGLVWRFQLHPDVVFHDGTSLDSERAGLALVRAGLLDLPHVSELEASGDHALTIRLHRPDMDFDRLLARPAYTISHVDAEGRTQGTGGYRVESATETTIHLTRIAEYWKPDRAYLDSVSLTLRTDDTPLHTDILAGNVDYTGSIGPETVGFLANLTDLDVTRFPATRALTLSPTACDHPEVARAAMRALQSAVNRQDLVDRALLGHGVIGDDTPFLPEGEVARAEIQMVGPTTTQALTVTREAESAWVDHLAHLARAKGVQIDIGPDGSGAVSADYRDADDLQSAMRCPGSAPATFDPESRECLAYAACLDKAQGIFDPAEREAERRRAYALLASSGRFYLPAWADDIVAHGKRVQHRENLAPHAPHDGYRVIERWWLA